MTSERSRPDLVPDEGGPEAIRGLADHFATEAESDRRELVRRDKARLEILAGHLGRLDGFPMVKVVVIGDDGQEQEKEKRLLFVDQTVGDRHGSYKLYLQPNGELAIYYRSGTEVDGRLEERDFPIEDHDYLKYGQRAIEAAGARIKKVLAAKTTAQTSA